MLNYIPQFLKGHTIPGMIMAAISFALLTAGDTIFKVISLGHRPAHQILLVNALFALIPIFLWAWMSGGFSQFRTEKMGRHITRGCIGVISSYMAILSYSILPLTSFYAILFTGPLIVTILSVIWLGEKIDRAQWIAITAGFIGIAIVTHGFGLVLESKSMVMLKGILLAFLSVICYAISVVTVRQMRLGETSLTFPLYGYSVCIVFGVVVCLFAGLPSFSWTEIKALIASGILCGIASIFLMTAYHRTPVVLVAPFQYTQIFWGALTGYVVWKHVPDLNLILGSIVVVGCGLFIIYRELRSKFSAENPLSLRREPR